MRSETVDSGSDDGKGSPPVSPEMIDVSPTLMGPDSPIVPGLRPLPLQARRSLSRGRPHASSARGRPSSEHDDGDSNDDRSSGSSRSSLHTPKASSLASSDDDFEDFEFTEAMRDNLMDDIMQYLEQSVIEGIYGDFLSGSRTVIYEPQWPADFEQPEGPLYEPGNQAEANEKFRLLYEPLRGWHKLEGKIVEPEKQSHLAQIMTRLGQHREYMATKQAPPEKRLGNFLLYRNLPDAAVEANVWSLINGAHVCIRRGEWELAEGRILKAFLMARNLRYDPLIAKCWYWRGIVSDRLKRRRSAAECFLEAMPCVGFYEEGEMMSNMILVYKDELLDLLDEQDAQHGEREFSKWARRAILGIDGCFRPLKPLPPGWGESQSHSSSQETPPEGSPNEAISPPATSPITPSLPAEHIDSLLNELNGNDELQYELDEQPQTISENTSDASIRRIPSNVSSNTFRDLNRRLDAKISPKVNAHIAMDAMSEAMEQARLRGEELDTEELTRIAEAAMKQATDRASSGRISLAHGENPDNEDIQNIEDNRESRGESVTASTSPVGVDLMTFSSSDGSGDTNEGKDHDAGTSPVLLVDSKFTVSPEDITPDRPSTDPAPDLIEFDSGTDGEPEDGDDDWEDEEDISPPTGAPLLNIAKQPPRAVNAAPEAEWEDEEDETF